FYTEELHFAYLVAGLAGLALVWAASRAGVRHHAFYLPAAFAIWYFFLESGVHATLAGVALGFLTPAHPMYSVGEFDRKARQVLDTYPATADTPVEREHADHEGLLLADISREAVAPLIRNEHRLAMWSSFFVIPIFALANAGVRFEGSITDALLSRPALGVLLGLVVGKTVGITLFSWAAVKSGLGKLPTATNWRQMVGVASIAGIGFTVALFITALAYTDATLADEAKVGIFAGSILSAIIGVVILSTGKKAGSKAAAPAEDPVSATA
ncbi:MAG: Na+/H+ antiporter NhaA, partial [Acidimicrobiia bacterium]|nr:Na+/H+ antiporter NhaA [Acidimicrobiia bacterium]